MDNMAIQNHLRSISGIGQLGQISELQPIESTPAGGAAEGPQFKDILAKSLEDVNAKMNESDKAIEDLATGRSTNIHHTLISLQKADISFRMLLEVRNKVIKAYEEVMRMQV